MNNYSSRRNSLLMGRELETSNSTTFSLNLYGDVQVSKIDLNQVKII